MTLAAARAGLGVAPCPHHPALPADASTQGSFVQIDQICAPERHLTQAPETMQIGGSASVIPDLLRRAA
jgi:hypothetical protein